MVFFLASVHPATLIAKAGGGGSRRDDRFFSSPPPPSNMARFIILGVLEGLRSVLYQWLLIRPAVCNTNNRTHGYRTVVVLVRKESVIGDLGQLFYCRPHQVASVEVSLCVGIKSFEGLSALFTKKMTLLR